MTTLQEPLGVTGATPLSTPDGGQLVSPVDEQAPESDIPQDLPADMEDLVELALRAARRSTNGVAARKAVRRPRRGRASAAGASDQNWSGSGRDDRDPQRLGAISRTVFDERGWQQSLTEARVFTDWPNLVGGDLAAHCRPASLHDGELKLEAQSTAWATQIRLMSTQLLARLATELGANVVKRLTVTGPAAPSWRHGFRTVPGARGPRDTYG